MDWTKPVVFLGKAYNQDEICEGYEIIGLELQLYEKLETFYIAVVDGFIVFTDIVETAQKIASAIADISIEEMTRQKTPIMCQKGCNACCKYMVSLSAPEAFAIRNKIMEMEAEEGRNTLEQTLDVSRTILEKFPIFFNDEQDETENQDAALSQWYSSLDIACPFLSEENGQCKIYEDRPIVCREHMVMSDPKQCAIENDLKKHEVPVPVSFSRVLAQLSAEMQCSDVDAVMLPLAVAWAQDNDEQCHRTWPAVKLMKRFVKIAQRFATENQAISQTQEQTNDMQTVVQ